MPVELAATSIASQSGVYSPQHVNNWSIQITGFLEGEPLTLALGRGFLPTVGNDEVPIPFGNETVYAAGRANYEGGTLEVRDYVDKDIQGVLSQWYSKVYKGILLNDSGVVGIPSDYKRMGRIYFSDPSGNNERSWRVRGIWPRQMSFGNLDMGSSEVVQVAIAMRYDKAFYLGAGS